MPGWYLDAGLGLRAGMHNDSTTLCCAAAKLAHVYTQNHKRTHRV